MKATILIDNNLRENETRDLRPEWGLSVHIEHEGHSLLLDTGKSPNFAHNAEILGIDLKSVNFGVLSHAHYDHADGMGAFFDINGEAKFYLQEGTKENCYSRRRFFGKYIGICKGYLEKYESRIVYAPRKCEIAHGITLLPHMTEGLAKIGRKSKLYIKRYGIIWSDNFEHEQSLVIDTKEGLVVFSSCSHGGACNIIREVEAAFPDKKIHALVGGLHLFRLNDSKVREVAREIKATGIKRIYTGHCTGDNALEILQEELGADVVKGIWTGLEIEV